MTDQVYREAFERAKADLSAAMDRRDKAQREANAAFNETVQLRRTVVALAQLCGEDVEDSMGLTQAVRTVFRVLPVNWLSVKDVKANVEAIGVSLADLKNADASVQSVLNRLTTGGELRVGNRREKTPNGVTAVKTWQSAAEPEMEPITDDDIPF